MEISARFDHDLAHYLTHLRAIERRFADRVVSQVTVIRPASAAEPVESWRASSATARANVPLRRRSARREAELEALRRSVARSSVFGGFGSAAWQEQPAERLGLQSTFRAPARPRKQTEKARY